MYQKYKLAKNVIAFIVAYSFLLLLNTHAALPKEIYMKVGESFILNNVDNIDKVFISNPEIVEHTIVDGAIIVYARKNGFTSMQTLDQNNHQSNYFSILVDPALGDVYAKIGHFLPNQDIKISKIGATYILAGTVNSLEEKELAYNIVGESVGVNRTTQGITDSNEKEITLYSTATYSNIINKIEVITTNQINVKLSVAEVTKSFTDNLGVDWSSLTTLGSDSVPLPAGEFRFNQSTAHKIVSAIHAINNDSIASILAEPNLSVLSGESASFLVGGEVPITTTSANGTDITYKPYGIILNFTAKANNRNKIFLTLLQEVSTPLANLTVSGGNYPTFSIRRTTTTIELADGQSFIIGGLLNTNEHESLSKIPLIGSIPILGAFFRHTSSSKEKKELVIVATVNLVKAISNNEIMLPTATYSSTLSRWLNLGAVQDINEQKTATHFLEQGGFIK